MPSAPEGRKSKRVAHGVSRGVARQPNRVSAPEGRQRIARGASPGSRRPNAVVLSPGGAEEGSPRRQPRGRDRQGLGFSAPEGRKRAGLAGPLTPLRG